MTPAERARQIDREEFAAECAAIRQRAYARIGLKPEHKPDPRVRAWVKREEPKAVFQPVFKPVVIRRPKLDPRTPPLHTVEGISLTQRQWAERLGIGVNAMHQRVHRHGSVVAAILKHVELNGPDVLELRHREGTC